MNASWRQLLAGVVRLERHLGHIEDEISNLAEELVLVDVPVEQSPWSAIREIWLTIVTRVEKFLPFGATPVQCASSQPTTSALVHFSMALEAKQGDTYPPGM